MRRHTRIHPNITHKLCLSMGKIIKLEFSKWISTKQPNLINATIKQYNLIMI